MFYLFCLVISPNNIKQKNHKQYPVRSVLWRIPILCQQHSLLSLWFYVVGIKSKMISPYKPVPAGLFFQLLGLLLNRNIYFSKKALHHKKEAPFFCLNSYCNLNSFPLILRESSIKRMQKCLFQLTGHGSKNVLNMRKLWLRLFLP